MSWLILIVSGVLETVCATALGKFEGFSRLAPTVVFAVGLVLSMAGLAYAMKELPLDTAYAAWVGIGATLTVVYAMATGTETISILKVLFLLMIIGGVVGLKSPSLLTSVHRNIDGGRKRCGSFQKLACCAMFSRIPCLVRQVEHRFGGLTGVSLGEKLWITMNAWEWGVLHRPTKSMSLPDLLYGAMAPTLLSAGESWLHGSSWGTRTGGSTTISGYCATRDPGKPTRLSNERPPRNRCHESNNRRALGATETTIETIDAQVLARISGNPAIREIAADADTRLKAALDQLRGA